MKKIELLPKLGHDETGNMRRSQSVILPHRGMFYCTVAELSEC